MLGHILLAGALSLFGIATASPLELQGRADTCAHDNLYRCFVDARYSAGATGYCAVLTYTSTIATTTATATVTASSTTTASTETDILSSTATLVSTVPSATVTVTSFVANVAKRAPTVLAGAAPACVTNYPLSRLTSACSCISVPAKTISVTFTATTVTVTATATVPVTSTTSTTAWATVSTVTTSGVQTVTVNVPLPTVTNGNFEAGMSAWDYYDNWDAYWDGSVTQAAGASGASSNVFSLTNNGNGGFALLTSLSTFNLINGVTYKLGFQVKSSAYGAQTSYNHLTVRFWDVYGHGLVGDISGGTPIGNGWVSFLYTFTVDSSYAGTGVSLSFSWSRDTVSSQYLIDNVYLQLA